MAGILEFLGDVYAPNFMENQRREKRAGVAKGLLEQQRADAGNNNPYTATIGSDGATSMGQPQGILGSGGSGGMPTPAQFMDLAMVPGYEQFGLQAQTGQQQRGLQDTRLAQQQGQYDATAGARESEFTRNQAMMRERMRQQAAEAQARLAQQQGQFNTGRESLTAYQQAQLNQRQEEIDYTRELGRPAPTGYRRMEDGSLAPEVGGAIDKAELKELADMQLGIDTLYDAEDLLDSEGTFVSGEQGKMMDATMENVVIPVMTQMNNSGVLSPTEREVYMEGLHQFNKWGSLTTMDSTARSKIVALRELMERKMDDRAKVMGRAMGGPP